MAIFAKNTYTVSNKTSDDQTHGEPAFDPSPQPNYRKNSKILLHTVKTLMPLVVNSGGVTDPNVLIAKLDLANEYTNKLIDSLSPLRSIGAYERSIFFTHAVNAVAKFGQSEINHERAIADVIRTLPTAKVEQLILQARTNFNDIVKNPDDAHNEQDAIVKMTVTNAVTALIDSAKSKFHQDEPSFQRGIDKLIEFLIDDSMRAVDLSLASGDAKESYKIKTFQFSNRLNAGVAIATSIISKEKDVLEGQAINDWGKTDVSGVFNPSCIDFQARFQKQYKQSMNAMELLVNRHLESLDVGALKYNKPVEPVVAENTFDKSALIVDNTPQKIITTEAATAKRKPYFFAKRIAKTGSSCAM